MNTPKLYLNENVAVRLVDSLKELCIEAIHTERVSNKGVDDEFQLRYAAKRGFILVTHNRRDFRELHNKWIKMEKKHSGILVMKPNEPEYLAKRIKLFFDRDYHTLTPPFCVSPPPLD